MNDQAIKLNRSQDASSGATPRRGCPSILYNARRFSTVSTLAYPFQSVVVRKNRSLIKTSDHGETGGGGEEKREGNSRRNKPRHRCYSSSSISRSRQKEKKRERERREKKNVSPNRLPRSFLIDFTSRPIVNAHPGLASRGSREAPTPATVSIKYSSPGSVQICTRC